MGPEMVRQFQEVIDALEADGQVRVVVFDSAVEDYFLNHSDFLAKLEDLTSMPPVPQACHLGRIFWCALPACQSSPSPSSAAGRRATAARSRSPAI